MAMMHGGGWWSYIRYDDKKSGQAISRALLRRIGGYAWPYRWRILLTLATILAITVLGLVPPLLYRALIDQALPRGDYGLLNLLAVGMIAVPVVSGLLGVVQRFLTATVGEGVIFDLRCALFGHLERMSLRFFTHTRTGELMSRLNNDVVGSQQAVTSTLTSIITNAISVVLTLAVMLTLEWRLTLASVAVLPLFILPSRRIGTALRRITREQLDNNVRLNALMNEALNVGGALLVKLFGRGADEQRRFAARAAAVRDSGIRQAIVTRWFFLGLSLVTAVGTALVFWFGGRLVLSGAFTVGTIVAFAAYLTQLYGPLSSLTNARVEFATSMVSFERVFEVLDLPLEIADRSSAVELGDAHGELRFEDVSFDYASGEPGARPFGLTEVERFDWQSRTAAIAAPAEVRMSSSPAPSGVPEEIRDGGRLVEAERHPTLRDITFEIKPGQLAALVGPSGAGKTTITYLVPRLYDPSAGRILIDGFDLCDVTQRSLAEQVGVVTQETYLFHDTVRANLLYAKPEATQAELEAACRAANIHDFLAGLPDGYDTVVGERGYRLSGGERQRISIARVILKNPRILVLDEATSHLDSHSEALIQTALEKLMRGRTSLVIAHRLSTVLAADVILVIDRGRLVERGTHAELLRLGGLYASLYETQFRQT